MGVGSRKVLGKSSDCGSKLGIYGKRGKRKRRSQEGERTDREEKEEGVAALVSGEKLG